MLATDFLKSWENFWSTQQDELWETFQDTSSSFFCCFTQIHNWEQAQGEERSWIWYVNITWHHPQSHECLGCRGVKGVYKCPSFEMSDWWLNPIHQKSQRKFFFTCRRKFMVRFFGFLVNWTDRRKIIGRVSLLPICWQTFCVTALCASSHIPLCENIHTCSQLQSCKTEWTKVCSIKRWTKIFVCLLLCF